MITVLFFAQVRELLGTSKAEISPSLNLTDAESLRLHLSKSNERWTKVLQSDKLLVAVNQELCAWDTLVSDGDEVAFFPPVTGG